MEFKVISGGQTGADMGGLLAAKELGITTGGSAPKGWRTENGPNVALRDKFGLIESSRSDYNTRTKQNVKDADVVLIFGDIKSAGSTLTNNIAISEKKPVFHIPFVYPIEIIYLDRKFSDISTLVVILHHLNVSVINIAGNRESVNPGIQEFTKTFCMRLFKEL